MEGNELTYYVQVLRRRWLLILALFVVVFTAGAAVSILSPGIYNSQAKILVESQQIPSDLVRSTVTSEASERIQVIEQRVMTRDNLLSIVTKFGLFSERPSGISGLLAGRRADMSGSELVDLMRDRVQIIPVELNSPRRGATSTLAFTVGFDYENPEIAVSVVNEFVTLILAEDARNRTNLASETTKFLEREVARLSSELTAVETEISDFKRQYSDALPEKLGTNLGRLERMEGAIVDLDREMQSVQQEKRLLEFELDIRQTQVGGMEPGKSPYLARLNALRTELVEKTAMYPDDHPMVKVLRVKVEALERQTEADYAAPDEDETPRKPDVNTRLVAEKIAAAESRREYLVAQRAKLVESVEAVKDVVARTSEVGTAFNVLERKRTALQTSLDEMADKYEEARLGERLEEGQQAERFQVIEQPTLPHEPVKPNRPKMLAFSFALALMAGFGSVAGLEMVDQSIRGRGDLKGLNGRLLGTIPYIATRGETRRRRLKAVLLTALLALLAAGILGGLHYFYMPLDLLLTKVMLRLSF